MPGRRYTGATVVLVHQLRAEVPANLCLYCERTLPVRKPGQRGRRRIKCDDCLSAYNADVSAQRRVNARAARATQGDDAHV